MPLLHVVTSVPLLQLIRATCAFHVLCAFTLLLNNSACLCCYVLYMCVCVFLCVCGHLGKRQLPVLNCKHTHTHTTLISVCFVALLAYFMHPSTPFGTFLGYWLCTAQCGVMWQRGTGKERGKGRSCRWQGGMAALMALLGVVAARHIDYRLGNWTVCALSIWLLCWTFGLAS